MTNIKDYEFSDDEINEAPAPFNFNERTIQNTVEIKFDPITRNPFGKMPLTENPKPFNTLTPVMPNYIYMKYVGILNTEAYRPKPSEHNPEV